MKKNPFIAIATKITFALTLPVTLYAASCPERADTYQQRYENSGRANDLICFQKASEREMSGQQTYNCPNSAQSYQTAYENRGRASDLVCFQQALNREMR